MENTKGLPCRPHTARHGSCVLRVAGWTLDTAATALASVGSGGSVEPFIPPASVGCGCRYVWGGCVASGGLRGCGAADEVAARLQGCGTWASSLHRPLLRLTLSPLLLPTQRGTRAHEGTQTNVIASAHMETSRFENPLMFF